VACAHLVAVAIFSNWPVLSSTLMMSITENNLGTAFLEKGQYDQAIAHHDARSRSGLTTRRLQQSRRALRAAGRLDDAVARYQQALAIKPDFASASYNLANALLEQGKAGDSVESFRRSLESNPKSVEAQTTSASRSRTAATPPARSPNSAPPWPSTTDSVHAHRNLGNMLVDADRRAEGMAHLERAAQLAPSEPEAIYDIGTILLQDQNFRAAAARFEPR
jgi:tetratricopeptide (TPR) repeat protein